MKKMINVLLIILFCFSLNSGSAVENTRVRLTIPPEQIPDPAWRRELFEGTLPLKNRPRIVSRKRVKDEVHLIVKNTGKTTLEYYVTGKEDVASPDRIRLYKEVFRRGLWRKSGWDWCCLGKTKYSILPGQSTKLVIGFRDDERGDRMLGNFREAGTNRSGLIVLLRSLDLMQVRFRF